MSYKTILVHCDASKSVSHRLGLAVDLAQRFGARLVGLHVRQPFETPVFADGSFPMDDFFKAHEEGVKADEAGASTAFAKAIKGKELATEWRLADGYADGEAPGQARYPTSSSLARRSPSPRRHRRTAGDRGARDRRPSLWCRTSAPSRRGRPSCCAGMPAARLRAAADALPFLKAAEKSSSWRSSQGLGRRPRRRTGC